MSSYPSYYEGKPDADIYATTYVSDSSCDTSSTTDTNSGGDCG